MATHAAAVATKRPHLAPFDFVRVSLCIAVVAHHVIFYIAAIRADEPDLTAAWETSPFLNFCAHSGIPAVDGFFLLSGFFTTLSLLHSHNQGPAMSPSQTILRIFARVMRFWPLHLLLVTIAILRCDPLFVRPTDHSWEMGRIAAMFIGKNYYDGLRGWFDLTTAPIWSNSADMHVSVFLIVLVSPLLASPRRLRCALTLALAVTIGLRAAEFWKDPPCQRLSCLGHPSNIFLAVGDPLKAELNENFGMPQLEERSCACALETGCQLSGAEWLRQYTCMYVPTHVRAAPFFVGALLACSYMHAGNDGVHTRAMRSSRANMWQLNARLLLALAWLLERHGVLALARLPGMLASGLPESTLEVLGGLLDAGAWACLLFAAIVPAAHPAHCRAISRFMSCAWLRKPAELTFCVYCLHWAVLFDFLKYMPRAWLPSNVYLLFFVPFVVVMGITFALAWLANRYIEVPSMLWTANVSRKALLALRRKTV